MTFEDYNYTMYNKFVLIDPNHASDDEQDCDFQANRKEEENLQPLRDNILEASISDKYQHKQLDVETESERQAALEEALAKKRLRQQKRLEEEELERLAEEEQQEEDDKSDKDQEGFEENEDEDIEYEVFFTQGEIQEALSMQKQDAFGDLIYEN